MSWTQTIMETILNVQAAERKKAYRQIQGQKQAAEHSGQQPAAQPATAPGPEPKGRYL